MPSWDVSFNRLAIKDYREAREYYAARSPQAAERFVDAVDAAIRRMMRAPNSLPIVSGRYRRVRVEKFPHSLVFYERAEHDIRIVAVAHSSRRLGYWRRRS
jgi:plasmid stabilization system protein ParE